MKISFKKEGGVAYFPGLSKPLELNSDNLPKDETNKLEQLVDETNFFNLPASNPNKIPRGFEYTIKIEKGKQQHTIKFSDMDTNPKLEDLLNYLNKKQKENVLK